MNEHTEGIARWLVGKNTGMSSKAMAAHFLGEKCNGSYPRDAGDFRRCEGLLDAVPGLRNRIGEMTSVNAYWAALVPKWAEIAAAPSDQQTWMIRAIVRPIQDKDSRFVCISDYSSISFR